MSNNVNKDYDLVILGGGSAAFSASIKAAEAGAKVLIIEKEQIGGTCVNRGCVPSKNLLHAAELYHSYSTTDFPGIPKGEDNPKFDVIFEQKDELVTDLRKAKYEDILKAFPTIDYVEGTGKFISPSLLEAGEKRYSAKMYLIATGASPMVPPITGLNESDYITYRGAISPEKQFNSLLIIGGGAIGLELGQVYNRLGTKVTIVEALLHVLPNHEPEIAAAIKGYLESEGINIYTDTVVDKIKKTSNGQNIYLNSEAESTQLETEMILIATGVSPNTDELSLELAGIEVGTKGEIPIDKYGRTKNKNIYAAGDVTGKKLLVTTAAYQGGLAIENGLLGRKIKQDDSLVPHAVFTSPQVASVGLTENEANGKGIKVLTSVLDFKHVPKAAAIRDSRGIIKMVINEKTSKVIGLHAACPNASEIIHSGMFIIKAGMTVGDIIRTIFIYPTMSESIKLAAIALGKDVSMLSCCAS